MLSCSKCGAEKAPNQFYPCKTHKSGRQSRCKDCQRVCAKEQWRSRPRDLQARAAWRRKNPEKMREYRRKDKLKTFGLTPEEYDKLLEAQNGVCAICRGSCTTGKRLAVDHCHESGKVRGLLCGSCNTSLGKFKDSPDLLRRAADYVERGSVAFL